MANFIIKLLQHPVARSRQLGIGRCDDWAVRSAASLNEPLAEAWPLDHPAFSVVSGHVRVLTVRQARELFELVGFQVEEARSTSILPLPDGLSRGLERVVKNRGHYLMLRGRKAG